MIDLIKDYAEKKIELVKLDATEKSLKIIGVSVPVMIISVLAIFFIFLLNVSLGLLLGNWLHNFAYGFLILAGFYLLLILLVFLMRNYIKKIITNKAIEMLFND